MVDGWMRAWKMSHFCSCSWRIAQLFLFPLLKWLFDSPLNLSFSWEWINEARHQQIKGAEDKTATKCGSSCASSAAVHQMWQTNKKRSGVLAPQQTLIACETQRTRLAFIVFHVFAAEASCRWLSVWSRCCVCAFLLSAAAPHARSQLFDSINQRVTGSASAVIHRTGAHKHPLCSCTESPPTPNPLSGCAKRFIFDFKTCYI